MQGWLANPTDIALVGFNDIPTAALVDRHSPCGCADIQLGAKL